MRYLFFISIALLFFGCAHIPTRQECYSTMQKVVKKQDDNASRVYIFTPRRGLGSLSLIGGWGDVELTYILIDDPKRSLGYIGNSTLAYIDIPSGAHSLYARNIDNKDDDNATLSSKIDFTSAPGENVYLIIKNNHTLGTAVVGRGYTRSYERIDVAKLDELIKANCEDSVILNVKNLTTK